MRDFGAVRDGITDDTAAVRSALDEVAICAGQVTVPPGTYCVSRLKLVPFVDSVPVETRRWTELDCVRVYHDFFSEHEAEFE